MDKPWRLVGLVMAMASMGGCGTHPEMKNTAAYDAIQASLETAAKQKASPGAINEALLPPLQLDLPALAVPVEPRFDLAVDGAAARQVFLALVAGTRYSMVLPPELDGKLSLSLKSVTVREALDSIRDMYGYDYALQGTRITVQPNTMQTRLYQVSYLATKRGGGSATRVSSSNGGGAASGTGVASSGLNESTTVFTGQSTDFWFDVSQALAITLNCDYELQRGANSQTTAASPAAVSMNQALTQRLEKLQCPEGRNFVVNQQSGVVMVRAMPNELREIGRLFKAMQANIERQVMIEAKILEVELSEGYQSGINWASFNKNGGHRWSNNANTDNFAFPGGRPFNGSTTDITVSPTDGTTVTTTDAYAAAALTGTTGILKTFSAAGALGLAFQATNFAAIINFLQTQGNVYVMSSPRIATLNNQKAVLKVGSDDYFVTSVTPPSYTSSGATGSSTSVNPPTITAQPFFSGVSLDVTPQVDESGLITLHVKPAVTKVSDKEKVINFGTLGSYSLPYASASVKETDSIVRVRDGMIVAIGGLMSQSQSDDNARVPGLGDVPVFNAFFKQNAVARGKREMVILLKPTVIREQADWQSDLVETDARMQGYDPRRYPLRDPLKPQ
ncbi:MAG: pilus (MSHA type) biogenesis protein MshL [Dechloromonas sp.]|nr:pilus (MSHA type) biogenesis protein MshL [Dechloromonas sp.]